MPTNSDFAAPLHCNVSRSTHHPSEPDFQVRQAVSLHLRFEQDLSGLVGSQEEAIAGVEVLQEGAFERERCPGARRDNGAAEGAVGSG
jgi:hypothetical protein